MMVLGNKSVYELNLLMQEPWWS